MRYGVAGDTSSFFFPSAYKSDSPKEALSIDIRVYRSMRLSRRVQDPQCQGLCQIPIEIFYGIDRNLVYSLVAKSNKNWRPTTKQNSGNSYLVCFVQGFQEMSKHTSVLFIFSGMSALYKLRRSTIGV